MKQVAGYLVDHEIVVLFVLFCVEVLVLGGIVVRHSIKWEVGALPLQLRLLNIITSNEVDRDNIIGDLLEESSQRPSRLGAHLWLYKQALKSVVPLILRIVKNRLASYFGERIR